MPFTHPFAKVLCPFCFEYFHLGLAPVRVFSTTSRKRVNDPVVQKFLGFPDSREASLPPVEEKKGIFSKALGCFYYPALYNGMVTRYRICPHCHMRLPIQLGNFGMGSNIIAVTGYRDAGKSNFFGVLIQALRNRYSQEVGLNIWGLDTFSVRRMCTVYSDDLYNERYGNSLLGNNPKAVSSTETAASNQDIRFPLIYRLNISVFSKWHKLCHPFAFLRPIDLVLFDAAGEDMSSPELMSLYCRYISRAAGIIALVDPLSYPEIREGISKDKYLSTTYQNRPYDTMGVLTHTIESYGHRKSTQQIKTPLAVTISKFDLLRNMGGLEPFVFDDHVHKNGFNARVADKTSAAIRRFLVRHGVNDIPAIVENNYKTYKYFGMSALGRSPDENRSLASIEPINVADSLFWILNKLGYLQTVDDMK